MSFIEKHKIKLIVLSGMLLFVAAFFVLFGNSNRKMPEIGLLFFGIPGVIIGSVVYFKSSQFNLLTSKNQVSSNIKADELLKWYELKEKGVITEAEFLLEKSKIMESN